jgi:hypothetical protein
MLPSSSSCRCCSSWSSLAAAPVPPPFTSTSSSRDYLLTHSGVQICNNHHAYQQWSTAAPSASVCGLPTSHTLCSTQPRKAKAP